MRVVSLFGRAVGGEMGMPGSDDRRLDDWCLIGGRNILYLYIAADQQISCLMVSWHRL